MAAIQNPDPTTAMHPPGASSTTREAITWVGGAARRLLTAALAPTWARALCQLGLFALGRGKERFARVDLERGLLHPGLLAMAGVGVDVCGTDALVPGENYIFIANFEGPVDVSALTVALPVPVRFVAPAELFAAPWVGAYLRAAGHAEDQRCPGGGLSTVAAAEIDVSLRHGHSVVFFPERHMADGRASLQFSGDFLQAARVAGVRVVPVGLSGSAAVKGSGLTGLRPGLIQVQIGSPVEVGEADDVHHFERQVAALRRRAGALAGGASAARRSVKRCWEREIAPDSAARRTMSSALRADAPRLVFFDIDHCLLAGSSVVAAARQAWRLGLVPMAAFIGAARRALAHARGTGDVHEMWRFGGAMTASISDADYERVAELCLKQDRAVALRPAVVSLIRHHQSVGDIVVFISSGYYPILRRLAAALGVKHVLAAWPQRMPDGSLQFSDVIPYGEGKVVRARQLASALDLPLDNAVFYTDGISDQPLLEMVGCPVAVSPQRRLRSLARVRAWPVLDLWDTVS